MVVVFLAPFGPSKPKTSPRGTSIVSPSTASVRPKRLVSDEKPDPDSEKDVAAANWSPLPSSEENTAVSAVGVRRIATGVRGSTLAPAARRDRRIEPAARSRPTGSRSPGRTASAR